MSFTVDITKFANKTKSTLDESTRAIKISLFNGVIRDTRVGNPDKWKSKPPPGYVGGRLRGNWQTTTGSPASDELDRIDHFDIGQDGGEAMAEVKKNVRGFTVDYLANNLPYAEVYEEIDGMVAKNMARIARIINEVNSGKR